MKNQLTIRKALEQASESLTQSSDTAKLDAEVLFCHALKVSKTKLITTANDVVDESKLKIFDALIKRREQGEPVAYITGTKEFWSLELKVTPDVLIPRPETELLVEVALELIADTKTPSVLDLGTGSGAIAIAIAKERPDAKIFAVDQSKAACEIAIQNAQTYGLSNVIVRHGNWFEPLTDHTFDLIVSNPPYVKSGNKHLQQGDVRFEPLSALTSGNQGLDAIKKIVSEAQNCLKPNAMLALEHGFDQAKEVKQALRENGFADMACRRDIAGCDRVSLGHLAQAE